MVMRTTRLISGRISSSRAFVLTRNCSGCVWLGLGPGLANLVYLNENALRGVGLSNDFFKHSTMVPKDYLSFHFNTCYVLKMSSHKRQLLPGL
jgi:hypothetical protein